MSNIKIRKFDPSKIDPCRTCVFIAKKNCGKSTLIKDILYHQRKIPLGVVMSGTEASNEHYGSFVPDSFIYGKYEPDVIKKVLTNQEKIVSKMTKAEKENFKDPSRSIFLVMDDCMFDNKWTRDDNMRCIFMNGRHYRIFFMLAMQYCMDLPPALRTNIDYLFVLKENIIQNREKIYKNFFGIFPDFDTFNEVLSLCTENYECLVLDNSSTSSKIEDCVFWYKAKKNTDFKIGSPAMWQHHKLHYSPNGDNNEQNEPKKKKKNTITVTKTDSEGKMKRVIKS